MASTKKNRLPDRLLTIILQISAPGWSISILFKNGSSSLFSRKMLKKYIDKHWSRLCLYLCRPYPFQLWIAPRKKKFFSDAEPKRKSPPGFSFKGKTESGEQTEYAMYLYPDGISIYWWIYFFNSVCLHVVLDIIFSISKHAEIRTTCKYITGEINYHLIPGIILFAIFYYLIYTCSRKPVLDELWPSWPDTQCQREYFKNICSRINFASRDNFYKYIGKYNICSCNKYKYASYFNRPVFFNPRGSIQEGMIRAAIADFFAVKKEKEFIKNIFIYYIPHVWISFLYLSVNLLLAFRWHPYKNQNETIPLLILIVVWAVVSVPILFKQYISIKLFYDYDEKLFKFSPKIACNLFKQKMRLNIDLVNSLNPKKTFILLHTLAFGSYLVILNLVMQYAEPNENKKLSIEIENGCKQVQVNIIESQPCQEKCCLKIIAE